MVAYSFKPQFVAPILAGMKRQTIRADRKRHAYAGETLQLYTGMRTKACRLIGTAVCKGVAEIRIDLDLRTVDIAHGPTWASFTMDADLDGFRPLRRLPRLASHAHLSGRPSTQTRPSSAECLICWDSLFTPIAAPAARLTAPESPSPA